MIFFGSFLLPLTGSGDKYGESVSTNNLSKGTISNAFLSSEDFLNVTIPLADI